MRIRLLLLSLLLAGTLFSQTVPVHKRLLYSDSLSNASSTGLGVMVNKRGEFIPGRGWKAIDQYSQLTITLPANLPPEGTFKINVTNFDPASQNVDDKQNILSMASDDSIYWLPQYETGSWWLYRTGNGYTDGPGLFGFRIDYAAKGVDTRSDGRAMQSTRWSKDKTYEFKVIWTAEWISFYVDNTLIMDPKISKTPWTGQSQFFRYVMIGRDSKGYAGQPGPIWSNARIYIAGPALVMTKVSGDNQNGYTSTILTNPLVVKIADVDGVSQANVPVSFSFTQGSGQFVETQPVLTDASGLATVHVKLGATAGASTIQAAAEGASGSPIAFTATATNPTIGLRKMSGDNQNGAAGAVLPASVIVKAVYKDGNPVPNEPVVLQTINGGTIDGQQVLSTTTNTEGQISAQWTLGPLAGLQKLRVAHGDSVVEFSATAAPSANQKLQLLSGGGQTGTPNQTLPAPIVVQVSDEYANPVANQSVLFAIAAGGGSLQGLTSKSVLTDAQGKASVLWTMGPYRGVPQQLQISSTHNSLPLQGSPLALQMDMGALPDAGLSTITATSPIIANGHDVSAITVTVRDGAGLPLAGYLVRLSASATGNKLVVADSLTNSAGQVAATLASTSAGSKIISGRVIGSDILLTSTATVLFEPVPQTASRIVMVSGNNQTGIVGTQLAQLLAVQVFNESAKAAANYPVEFYIISGSAALSGAAQITVMTDEQGLARASLTLGETYGAVTVGARTAPLTSVITFSATAASGAAYQMVAQSGFSQSGLPGKALANPIVVAVKDVYGNPARDYPVLFTVVSGGGTVGGSSQVAVSTGAAGTASIYWTLGRYLGVLNRLEITSSNNYSSLAGSPLNMQINQPQLPDISKCTISATSPAIADGAALSTITVTLLDPNYRPLSGFTVDLSASGSANLITLSDSLSDRDGLVIAQLRSTKAEDKIISASIKGAGIFLNDTARVSFTAPARLDQLLYVSGDGQTGRIGTLLPQPLVVRVVDYKKKAKGGVAVEFAIAEGGGLVNRRAKSTVHSDTAGYCSMLWTLGPMAGRNNNSITAKIGSSSAAALIFTASAAAGEPAQWSILSGNRQSGTVGQPLAEPLSVLVRDSNGNAVLDFPVLFRVVQGEGAFAGAKEYATKTNASGIASALLTLGTLAIPQQVQVLSSQTPLDLLIFAATALPEAPARLVIVGSDSQQVAPGSAKYTGLVVRLVDRFSNPVPGKQVRLTALDGGHVTSQSSALSDAKGEAAFQVTPGERPGAFHFACRADSAVTTTITLIAIAKTNHAPIIASFSPADTVSVVALGTQLNFQFDSVLDPDGDSLRFQWCINDAPVSTQSILSLVVNPTLQIADDGTFTITGIVSDQSYSARIRWHYRINLTGVETISEGLLPQAVHLEQNYPNPFNSSTAIHLALPVQTEVSLRIYSLSGQLVTTLFNGELPAGPHRFSWQGRDSQGEPMPSGVYYSVLNAGAVRQTRKIVLMR